jgi:hypothetical protein
MKKFICVLVFLALVNVANAGMVDIVISSLNGVPITPVKEITIKPTDVINFDIVYTLTNGGVQEGWVFSLSKILLVQGPGTLDISAITRPTGYWNPDFTSITPDPLNPGSALIDAAAVDIQTVPPGIILDHFLLHCDALGDVLLTLVETDRTRAGASWETDGGDIYALVSGPGVIVHQIPEPMTLTLLGLGGLFLARRKK